MRRLDVVDDKRRPVGLEYISLVELLGVPLLKHEINIKIFFCLETPSFRIQSYRILIRFIRNVHEIIINLTPG